MNLLRQILIVIFFVGLTAACRSEDASTDFRTVVGERSCDNLDLPDAPLRAFRLPDGSITAFATHYRNRALKGAGFESLVENCSVVYEGKLDPDPSHFDYKTWITATWISDDGTIFALGHNEYQAHELPGRCQFSDYASCWYNSIVLLRSDDRGMTFYRVSEKPILAPDFRDTVGQGHPRGYTSPTNIVRWGDYLYTLVGYSGVDKNDRKRCVVRSSLPITDQSWSILTDEGFVSPNRDPYSSSAQVRCTPISGMKGFVGSIARLADQDIFVATVAEDDEAGGSVVIYFSDDLVHWRNRQILKHLSLFWSRRCSQDHRYTYPSLVDESSPMPNFDQVGGAPTLYLVQGACKVGADRALVRTRVQIVGP